VGKYHTIVCTETWLFPDVRKPGPLANFPVDRRGVTAVEFALLAPLFLLILCAWTEVGLCLLMESALDNAARDASRLIRTGSATETTFKAAVCAKVSPIIPCASVTYNVQSGSSFSSLSVVAASSTGSLSSTGFTAGSSGSDMLVQVAYSKPAFFSVFLKKAGLGGNILIMSTLAFQNETY
jgi:Flp pilus assembly protein TadG